MGGGLSETPPTPPATPSSWVFSALPFKKKKQFHSFIFGCAGPSLLQGLFSSYVSGDYSLVAV